MGSDSSSGPRRRAWNRLDPDAVHALAYDILHVPTPGSNFSWRNGNAINSVVHGLVFAAREDGISSAVAVQESRPHDLDVPMLFVPFGSNLSRRARTADAALGASAGWRPNSSRQYAPLVELVGADADARIILHNAAQPLRSLSRRLTRAPLFLYAHNELFRTFSRREATRALAVTDATIAVSAHIADRVASAAPRQTRRLRVVLNGVDTRRFRPGGAKDRRTRVLFVGRVHPTKGVHHLVEAAVRLAQSRRDFEVLVVGSPTLHPTESLDEYEVALRRSAVDARGQVQFRPFCDRLRLPALLQSADIFVCPSVWDDPAPLSLLEGMASGLATVTSRRGGIPEIGCDAVRYVDPADTALLAEALDDLIADPTLRDDLGTRARLRALELDWSLQFKVLKEILDL